jgi:hypothetical protein
LLNGIAIYTGINSFYLWDDYDVENYVPILVKVDLFRGAVGFAAGLAGGMELGDAAAAGAVLGAGFSLGRYLGL